jgi:hypothetical protein
MKREDIIQMAREAGFEADPDNVWITDGYWFEELARFAALVAAAEREECAKQLNALGNDHCAAAIRARSKA